MPRQQATPARLGKTDDHKCWATIENATVLAILVLLRTFLGGTLGPKFEERWACPGSGGPSEQTETLDDHPLRDLTGTSRAVAVDFRSGT